jgi:hypothetical protein
VPDPENLDLGNDAGPWGPAPAWVGLAVLAAGTTLVGLAAWLVIVCVGRG